MGNYVSDQKNARFFGLKFSRNTDQELIEQLEKQPNIQEYIKRLIREDMKKGANKMKFTIKPEFLDLWGSDAYEDTEITLDTVERCAAGWEKPLDEVLDQLNPVNYNAAVALMDDDLREEIHADLSPCSEAAFLVEYAKRHEQKYGQPFEY